MITFELPSYHLSLFANKLMAIYMYAKRTNERMNQRTKITSERSSLNNIYVRSIIVRDYGQIIVRANCSIGGYVLLTKSIHGANHRPRSFDPVELLLLHIITI
jgi:hypothetical protein